nr:hypothetical protein mv_L832 [Moumouvirus Monve]
MYDLYKNLLQIETEYSLYLTQKIFFFYGYNKKNIHEFFYKNTNNKLAEYNPILIWEYIILRSKLLLNLDNFHWNNLSDLRVNRDNLIDTINFMKIDKDFVKKLKFNCTFDNSFSYNLIDIDWNYI